MRKDDLPPLEALRAFDAAARHLSFTRAAEELFVTQSAVSKQVIALESARATPQSPSPNCVARQMNCAAARSRP